ncbi:hypothetical protein D3C76_1297640 [compost metagenome]
MRIGWIILGTAVNEGFTVLSQGARIDGKQAKELVLLQGRHQRALVELKSNRDRRTVALKQGFRPAINRLGRVLNDREVPPGFPCDLQTHVVLGVCPIYSDISSEFLRQERLHQQPPLALKYMQGHACLRPAKAI